ncbi:MAG TPA: SDR family NAD(P)-dependent oxidoreductase, partial [Terracidiphilus sp.]|nr:SDR family NAD(P)-dependent oxidoreductase [Terracidiphilus sp.]
LRLTQLLETLRPAPRLWLVTRGAQALEETPVNAAQAGLWGLGRTIARELPFLACTNVDLDPEINDLRGLWLEFAGEPGESQVMLRRGKRYVLRMEPTRFQRKAAPYRIGLESYGQFDALKKEPLKVPKPGPGEVLIRTETVGLNFRDVLNALGMLPEYAAELGIRSAAEMTFGFECGGIVEAVGNGVTRVAPGDSVIAGPIKAALATHVLADTRRVIAAPRELAALPVAYMTASYALESLAKLKPGERVLIHAAAGGVGMMAAQIAQRIGAEVYATAHPDKWPTLRAMGVRHLMSSRDTKFGDMTVNADVVLNSLTGEMIDASLRACAPGARFIEIGKKDIWPAERVGALRPDVAYHAFTFSEVADDQPKVVEELLDKLRTAPRLPVTRFTADQIPAAFQFMSQARHVGKIVIEMPRQGGITVRPDGTYWVTGGRGALGRRVAKWLVEQGAGRVLLSGRSAGVNLGSALGERIEYRPCDVSSAGAVRRLVGEIGTCLRGIVHAAGVIDDGVIAAQSAERFRRVYEPKGVAVRNIAAATAKLQLDFLVLFSSTAAILGTAGQANYAAANASMDAMAHNLRAQGRPALSIQWGPWGEHGLAASLSDENRKRLGARGMEFMDARGCLAAMDALAGAGLAEAAVAPMSWERYVASLPPGCPTAMFERVAPARNLAQRNLMAELDAVPANQRRAILQRFVREQIARSLGIADENTIGERQRLFDLGFDSLMAVELRNRLEAALKKPLRRTLAFDFPRVDALTDHLADVLELPARVPAAATDSEGISEQSLDAELENRLAAASRYLGEEL